MDMKLQNKNTVIAADIYTWSIFVRGYDAYVGQQWK